MNILTFSVNFENHVSSAISVKFFSIFFSQPNPILFWLEINDRLGNCAVCYMSNANFLFYLVVTGFTEKTNFTHISSLETLLSFK